MYPKQVPQSIQQTKKQTQMESQQDIVDLTINDDDDCHLNECFNGKFNDDHCSVQNYLYCFSCKTVTSIHNNNSCKTITSVHNNKKHKFDM